MSVAAHADKFFASESIVMDEQRDDVQNIVSDFVRKKRNTTYDELKRHLETKNVGPEDIERVLVDELLDVEKVPVTSELSPFIPKLENYARPVNVKYRVLKYDINILVTERDMPGILGLLPPEQSSGLVPSSSEYSGIKPSPETIVTLVSRSYELL